MVVDTHETHGQSQHLDACSSRSTVSVRIASHGSCVVQGSSQNGEEVACDHSVESPNASGSECA